MVSRSSFRLSLVNDIPEKRKPIYQAGTGGQSEADLTRRTHTVDQGIRRTVTRLPGLLGPEAALDRRGGHERGRRSAEMHREAVGGTRGVPSGLPVRASRGGALTIPPVQITFANQNEERKADTAWTRRIDSDAQGVRRPRTSSPPQPVER